MDWPHDPDGEEGSEGRRKYGHAVLAKKVNEEEDFPLTAAEYVDQYGDHPVRIDYETVVSVADIFEYVDQEEFADFPDFHKALGRALREADWWPYRLEHA
ncbi:DUF5785 family protein [Haloarcula sp. 1CSR25-25]|uniref:DUF5785 family protein n=1 Tax=Haloarcula sp. 1CSR25-25 TaxID=2862545 RepID=UPI002893E307|nr:DUF5785 family protein [Haloarcula sp. 1CSR25-25]MDT3434716.1 hypothetical protein [Haloarcula sp. 1CSR25-25]